MTRWFTDPMDTSNPPSRTHRVTREDLTFEVADAGPRDGEPVLLLHGFPEDASSWDAVLPRLHRVGLRTLTLDQRGYAPEAAPPEKARYRTGDLVGDVLAVLDALDIDRVHLVGHDWGGGIAWATAQRAPERLATLTVLSTPHPSAVRRALRTLDQLRRSWYIGAFQVPRLPELALSRGMHRFLARAGLPDSVARRYAGRFSTPRSLRGPINWYRSASLTGGRSGATEVITVPTTYVWGNRDAALGRTGAEGTAAFVGADYRFVELDAGHWLPELEPEAVADAVRERVRGR